MVFQMTVMMFSIFFTIASVVVAVNTNSEVDLIDIAPENGNYYSIYSVNNKCLRYCIDPSRSQVYSNINLLWKFQKPTIYSEYTLESIDMRDEQPLNCPIITTSNCEISEFTSGMIDEFTIINEKRELHGQSATKFDINNDTETLHVTTSGNIAWMQIEIPIDWQEIDAHHTLLSLKQIHDAKVYHLVANKPPPGGWQVKLQGLSENSTYNITILTVKKPLRPVIMQKIDSPVQSRAEDSKFVIEETGHLNKSARVIFDVNNDNVDVVRDGEIDKLAKIRTNNNLELYRKEIEVDLAPETSLVSYPGREHRIIFTVTNLYVSTILHFFRVQSSTLRILNVYPASWWIEPGQTINVAVELLAPGQSDNYSPTVDFIVSRGANFEDIRKSAYIYIQNPGTPVTDFTNPTITYTFNDNCHGKLKEDRCGKSLWTVEITATDTESGLKRVSSQYTGLQAKENFIAGTKSPTTFLYSSTCCHTMLQFTATDVAGNSYSRTISVTEWDNLTTGEIAAIVVGCLLLLIIIILSILLCIYCIRKRQSTDITYTQRYGSRSAPRTERTTF